MTNENDGGGLAALAGMTREADDANPDPQQVEQQEQEARQETEAEQGAREWGRIMFVIGGVVTMVAPELKPVYAELRCFEWGLNAHSVAQKYGWKTQAVPELALVASTIGFAVPTVLVLKEKAKQIREVKDAGLFGKIVLWWRHRRAPKGAAADAPPAAGGVAEVASDGRQ